MINHHELLRSLLDQTINSKYKDKDYLVNYTEADLFELWKVLKSKKRKYPIIWLQTGYRVSQDVRGMKTNLDNLRLMFITLGSADDFYQRRFTDTYEEILYPLLHSFLEKIRNTAGIRLTHDNYSFSALPFNDVSALDIRYSDYGNKAKSETTTLPDIWDAVLLETSLTIDNECHIVKPFKIK